MKVRTLRIIHVSSYYPPHLGGQENAVHDLAEQLSSAGHQVHVLTSNIGTGNTSTSSEKSVHIRWLRGFTFGHAPIMPWFPVALFRITREKSIVHLHIGQAFTPEMVWLVSRLHRFPYIAQLHIDFEPSGPAGILLPLYKRFILKRVLQSASAIVTLNEKTLHIVREAYQYTGKIQVMNNGIDEIYFTLKRPPFATAPPKILQLLFVGRLSKQKNIYALLEALRLTKRRVHLDVIGEGTEGASVKKTIATNNLTNVTLHGRLKREEVMTFYGACDALVMPSLYEAQPLVLLEAMATRIPIIGTNVIGVADHIKDAGIIVEPTAEGLAAGIERYDTEYASLAKMVERGLDIAKKARWSNMLEKYETLYEEALAD